MNKFAKIFLIIGLSAFLLIINFNLVSAAQCDCSDNVVRTCDSCGSCGPAGVQCMQIIDTDNPGGGGTQTGGSGGGTQTGGSVSLNNPLGDVTNPNQLIGNVIRALLGIVGSLALAVFIFGGFTWVISAGNEEKIKKGKDMILWATLGLVVIFFSYALVTFVLGAIGGASS